MLKNTLARRAFADSGMELPEDYLVKSTAVSFAFTDPASTAKALNDATKGNELVKVKGGFMSGQLLNAAQVKSLSDMPPLPVVRANCWAFYKLRLANWSAQLPNPRAVWLLFSRLSAEKAPAAA